MADGRGDAPDDVLAMLTEMAQVVRGYLLGAGRAASAGGVVATNPKGEVTRAFDAEAERLALEVAASRLGSFRALSEERDEVVVGRDPRWRLVIDPCDGSNNLRRGVRAVGFAAAVLPADAPLDPDRVEYAVCADVFTGSLYAAARGRGATLDGRPCRASAVSDLRRALVGVNAGRLGSGPARDAAGAAAGPPMQVVRLLGQVSAARRMGATVLDLCYVAQGAYEAYLDLRSRLTPENFMAPALIIREAGGLFTDGVGHPLGAVEFTRGYDVVAAGNAELHAAILRALGGAG